MRYWWNRFLSWWHDWPSWVITYEDGKSHPLRREDAETRAALFGGVRIDYARDEYGNLIRPPIKPYDPLAD